MKYNNEMDAESIQLAEKVYRPIFVIIATKRYTSEDQSGGLLPFVFYQDGNGYEYEDQDGENFWSRLFKIFAPAAKAGARSLMKHGIKTVVNTVGDVAKGEDWKIAAKRRLGETGDNILSQIQGKVADMVGSGYPMDVLDKYGNVHAYIPNRLQLSHPSESYRTDKKTAATRALLSIEAPPVVNRRPTKRKLPCESRKPCKKPKKSSKTKKSKKVNKVKKVSGTNKKSNKSKTKKPRAKKAKSNLKRKRNIQAFQAGNGYTNWL